MEVGARWPLLMLRPEVAAAEAAVSGHCASDPELRIACPACSAPPGQDCRGFGYCQARSTACGEEWVCPACGTPDSQLPIGHSVAYPFRLGGVKDMRQPTCEVLPEPSPDTIERYLHSPAPALREAQGDPQ